MQPIMLVIFMAIMSLTSWQLFQQMNKYEQAQDVGAVVHTMRELAKTQRVWHVQHGEGVTWQRRYLTHVPDNCNVPSCAHLWLQLSTPLWYCEITSGERTGDRVPVFGHSPSCPAAISTNPFTSQITDRDGNPRGPSTTVAEANIQGQAVPWWNAGHEDANDYATWATRDGSATRLAGDHSFQVIYKAGPAGPSSPAKDWAHARARAQRVANALGALACVGRKESGTPPRPINTWYDCDEGAEVGRVRGPGGATPPDNAAYYVIARYERPLARTMVDSMLSRDGKLHAYGDLSFGDGTGHSEISLSHDSGNLEMSNVDRLLVGCGQVPGCEAKRHVDLDVRAILSGGLAVSTQMRGDLPLPGLYMRTQTPHVPIKLVGAAAGPAATLGPVQMVARSTTPGVVDGVSGLHPPAGSSAVTITALNGTRMVVCSDNHVSGCAEYHSVP